MRLPYQLGFVLLVGALLASSLHGQAPVEITKVADGVYAIHRAYVGSNAAAIITDREVIIVDSHATPAASRHTLAALRRITPNPVTTVINTHWHTDHTAGNASYAETYGPNVRIISHHTVSEDLPSLGVQQMARTAQFVRSALEQARKQLTEDPSSLSTEERADLEHYIQDESKSLESLDELKFVLPTMTFERSLTLHTESFPIHILFLGKGHTRGDVVVFLPAQKTVITGDLLTSPQLYVGNSSHPSRWVESLRALGNLDFEHVIPGHGSIIQGKDYLEMVTLMLDSVIREVSDGLKRGLKFDEILKQMTLNDLREQYLSEHPDQAETFDRAARFLEDAVGFAYVEAKRNHGN